MDEEELAEREELVEDGLKTKVADACFAAGFLLGGVAHVTPEEVLEGLSIPKGVVAGGAAVLTALSFVIRYWPDKNGAADKNLEGKTSV
jgi:hypothetical protein